MYSDNDSYGCLGTIIFFLIIIPLFKILGIATLVLLAIALITFLVRHYKASAIEKEEDAKSQMLRKQQQAEEKERASYDAYFRAQDGFGDADKLKEANSIIIALNEDADPFRRKEILSFYNKYLPLMTESIEACKRNSLDSGDMISKFTETVRNFSDELYKSKEVVEINSKVMETLSIKDGLYDPYKIKADTDCDTIE